MNIYIFIQNDAPNRRCYKVIEFKVQIHQNVEYKNTKGNDYVREEDIDIFCGIYMFKKVCRI